VKKILKKSGIVLISALGIFLFLEYLVMAFGVVPKEQTQVLPELKTKTILFHPIEEDLRFVSSADGWLKTSTGTLVIKEETTESFFKKEYDVVWVYSKQDLNRINIFGLKLGTEVLNLLSLDALPNTTWPRSFFKAPKSVGLKVVQGSTLISTFIEIDWVFGLLASFMLFLVGVGILEILLF